MKIFLPFALFLFLAAPGSLHAGNLKNIIKQSSDSVVIISAKISAENMSGRSQGTGFFVNSKGCIITNMHVITDTVEMTVKTADGSKYAIQDVLASDIDNDLVLFSVKGINRSQKFLELSGSTPEVGDSIVVIGNPLGFEQTVSTGIISARRSMEDFIDVFQITAPVSPGSSGSPVLDQEGKVVGIVSFQSKEGQNLNFMVKASHAQKLIAAAKPMPYATWIKTGAGYTAKTPQGLTRQGYEFYRDLRFKDALQCAYKAIKYQKGFAKAYQLAGISLSCLGVNGKALDYLKYALKLNPDLENAHDDLGNVYQRMGLSGEATEEYFSEITANQKNYRPYYDLAGLYQASGSPEDAENILKEGIAKSSEPAYLHARLGMLYTDDPTGINSAEPEIRTALKMDEYNIAAHYALGVYYFKKGQKQDAINEYQVLKKTSPELAMDLFRIIYNDDAGAVK